MAEVAQQRSDVARARASRARRPKVEVEEFKAATPAEMRALTKDIKIQEREPEKHGLLVGALAAKNILQEGPPGTAKSMLCREFCKRIGVLDDQLNYFEKTLHPQMPADAIMGSYDMEKLLQESRLERKIEGYLPSAHVGNLDEIARINGPVSDALLPLLNTTERLYEHNGSMKRAPTLFMVMATNFMPDPDDPHLGAFVSRITLTLRVRYLKSDDSFTQLIREDQARKRGEPGTEPQVHIPLQAFIAAQREVRFVDITQGDFLSDYAKLRRACASEGLTVDDRRWTELTDIVRASAWLAGRSFCIDEDLAVLEYGLPRLASDIPTVLKLLLPFRSTYEQKAGTLREEAQEAMDYHAQVRPIVEGTPPTSPIEREISLALGDKNRVMKTVYGRAKEALAEAERQQRDATGIRDLIAELEDWRVWRENNDLPAKW